MFESGVGPKARLVRIDNEGRPSAEALWQPSPSNAGTDERQK